MSTNRGIIEPPTGFEAFGSAMEDLYIHFLIALAVTLMMSFLAILANSLAKRPNPATHGAAGTEGYRSRLRGELTDYSLYCGAFAFFGLVTAYFLALGLTAGDQDQTNSLASTFATPFISLLTAGVAFVASRSRGQFVSNELVLGVLSFLLACMLSYHTYTKQKFDLIAEAPIPIPSSGPAGGTEPSPDLPAPPAPPSEGNDDGDAASGPALPPPRRN